MFWLMASSRPQDGNKPEQDFHRVSLRRWLPIHPFAGRNPADFEVYPKQGMVAAFLRRPTGKVYIEDWELG